MSTIRSAAKILKVDSEFHGSLSNADDDDEAIVDEDDALDRNLARKDEAASLSGDIMAEEEEDVVEGAILERSTYDRSRRDGLTGVTDWDAMLSGVGDMNAECRLVLISHMY